MLVGRSRELTALDAARAAARDGWSSALVISGEAGIGKSALLAEVARRADGAVLSTVGIEGESAVPYVHLADVLRPVHHLLAEIPERQAAALASVLAIGPPTAADRFAVAAAALSLLGVLGGRGTLTVLVDDCQWIDQASLDVLTFVARRLDAEGVVLVFAARTGFEVAQLARLPTLRLEGLDEAAARELVAASAPRPLSDAARTRLLAEANGNPLALQELPRLLTPSQLATWTRGLNPLPIDSLLEQAFCGSVRDLDDETQQALLLLATVGTVPPAVLDRALAVAGVAPAAIEPAERAGLLTETDGYLAFRHPLVRSAVYQTSSGSRRRAAHLAAATAFEGAELPGSLERKAWHLITAGASADEALARTLEQAAQAEARASNFAVAGILFERSTQLTPRSGPVARRLMQAADCTRLAGDIDGAYELLRRALPLADDPSLAVSITYYLLRIAVWQRDAAQGRDDLIQLAGRVRAVDPALAGQMLTDAALVSAELGQLDAALEQSAEALVLARTEDGRVPLAVVAVRSMVLAAGGDAEQALELIGDRDQEVDAIDPLAADLTDQLLLVVGLVHLALEQVGRSALVLERAVSAARQRGAAGVLPFRLGWLACTQFWQGRWSAARATAHEAITIADDTGWASERPAGLAALARIEAVTGRAEECRRHAAESLALAEEAGKRPHEAYAHAALGLLELSSGHHPAAATHLEQVAALAHASGLTDSPLVWWSSDLVEAYVQEDRLDEARATLARLESSVSSSRIPTGAAAAARCRALIEPDSAERHLADALREHARASMPFEAARTRLVLGAHLRRTRRRAAAQEHLRAAMVTFDQLGASTWAERARSELRALGVSVGTPRRGLEQLTPQELQVALAVARGATNREVAAELFLSVKTVEFHLSHVFHKLQVSRRSQLVAVVAPTTTAGRLAGTTMGRSVDARRDRR